MPQTISKDVGYAEATWDLPTARSHRPPATMSRATTRAGVNAAATFFFMTSSPLSSSGQ